MSHYAAVIALLSSALALGAYALFTSVGGTGYSDSAIVILTRALRLMLPVSLLSGVLFTLIGVRLHTQISSQTRSVGLLTMANTIGAMFGALLGGFVLLPGLGLEWSFVVIAGVYVVIGALLAWDRIRVQSRIEAASLVSAGALWVVLCVLFPYGMMRERIFPLVVSRFAQQQDHRFTAREGVIETIFYVEEQSFGRPYTYRLLTNGIAMSGTGVNGSRYMKMFVYLPVAIHPAPRQALLISYGVGSTAKALTDTRELERINVVDISRDILEMNDIVFPDPATHPLNDPRVNVHIDDGRFFLQVTDRRYDLITGEPPPPKAAGIVNLYTKEYFQLIHGRLAPGGMCTYWLPVAQLTDAETKAILRAFIESFDDASLWIGSGTEWIMLGVRDGAERVDETRFRRQWDDPIVGTEIRSLGFESPQELGATFVADKQQLTEIVRGTPPLTDNYPYRLSTRTIHELINDYAALVEPVAAMQRFTASRNIQRLWPASMIRASLPMFEFRVLRHDAMTGYRIGAPAFRPAVVHHILTKSDLRSLVHWIYGTDDVELRIAEQVVGENGADGKAHFLLGCRDLADRQYADAAAHLRQARQMGYRAQLTIYDEMFALCMAGRLDEARQIAQQNEAPDALRAYHDTWWRFAESTFGLSQPSSLPIR